MEVDEQTTPPDDRVSDGRRTLAEKIDWLFNTVHPPGRGPHSYVEVAAAIERDTGETVSHTTLWKLRTGRSDNPTKRLIEALAAYFKVPVAFFFDEDDAETISQQVELLALMRDAGIKRAHLCTLFELSPQARQLVGEMIESAARIEKQRRDPDKHLSGGH